MLDPRNDSKPNIVNREVSIETELDNMWNKIQELKLTDEFAAQVMYEKYKARIGELPPPIE